MNVLKRYMGYVPTDRGAYKWEGGDFNLIDIHWPDGNVKPYATNSKQCHQFLAISKDTFLDQMIDINM
jgi:hypothetical protein